MKEASKNSLYAQYTLRVQGPTDVFTVLVNNFPDTKRFQLIQLLREGYVKVNEELAFAAMTVQKGDVITLNRDRLFEDISLSPESLQIDIVFEDEYVVVVNKPANMVVHPNHQHKSGTLVNALLHRYPNLPYQKGNRLQAGLVHRIDKGTTGLIVAAKDWDSMKSLNQQFYEHSVGRTYKAIVWGEMPEKGTINIGLKRTGEQKRISATCTEGAYCKPAITHFELENALPYLSLISCNLETGRTHQIRAHMKYFGHPLFNDRLYNGDYPVFGPQTTRYKDFVYQNFRSLQRPMLHAATLSFIHPKTQERLSFHQPIPQDMNNLLDRWKQHFY